MRLLQSALIAETLKPGRAETCRGWNLLESFAIGIKSDKCACLPVPSRAEHSPRRLLLPFLFATFSSVLRRAAQDGGRERAENLFLIQISLASGCEGVDWDHESVAFQDSLPPHRRKSLIKLKDIGKWRPRAVSLIAGATVPSSFPLTYILINNSVMKLLGHDFFFESPVRAVHSWIIKTMKNWFRRKFHKLTRHGLWRKVMKALRGLHTDWFGLLQ